VGRAYACRSDQKNVHRPPPESLGNGTSWATAVFVPVTIKLQLTSHCETCQRLLVVTQRYNRAMEMPSWVPDGETKPAPQPLLLVQSFVNTWEGDSGVDLLADASMARAWLANAGLLTSTGALVVADLATARDVRESIRALLVHNAGGPAPPASELEALQQVGRADRLAFTIRPDGQAELEIISSGPLRLATLLLIIRDAQHQGTWARLKACHNGECLWAFYDRSHASRGAWCDMAVCGNRVKNRALRLRKTKATDSSET
jgi:predicted RNA-binding Zn ribbon-like protein